MPSEAATLRRLAPQKMLPATMPIQWPSASLRRLAPQGRPHETTEPPPTTLVLTAHLVGSRARHRGSGSFAGTATLQSLMHELDIWIAMSPGLCHPSVAVHIVHDVVAGNKSSDGKFRGATLHRFPPSANELGGDRRWELYSIVLRRRLRMQQWRCAFAVDLDVAVVQLPRCGALASSALYIGSDGCSLKIKSWLQKAGRNTRLNETWDGAFRAFTADNHSTVYNSGIVGGLRDVFVPQLQAVVERLAAFRATALGNESRHVAGADMLVWNEVARAALLSTASDASRGLAMPATLATMRPRGVVTGFPHGPVNLPMWAKASSRDLCAGAPPVRPTTTTSTGTHDAAAASRPLNTPENYAWLNSSGLGRYWFGHKLPRHWLNLLRLHACWPGAARSVAAQLTLQRIHAGRFQCECKRVGEDISVRTRLLAGVEAG